MDWPISEVARMSGVTARTLRHYDETGLLPPARIGANGHRYYEEQQVDAVDALRGRHRRLLAEQDRLDALAGTVSRTIAALEQSRKDGNPMTINRPENLFEASIPPSTRRTCATSPSSPGRSDSAQPR